MYICIYVCIYVRMVLMNSYLLHAHDITNKATRRNKHHSDFKLLPTKLNPIFFPRGLKKICFANVSNKIVSVVGHILIYLNCLSGDLTSNRIYA